MKIIGIKIHNVRRKAGTVKKLPLYFLEKKKNRITHAKRGITHSRGSTLVERSADWISATLLEFSLKYAGRACAKNGETRIAPRKRGRIQIRRCFFATPILLEKIVTKITVENVMPTNITALREWVKKMAPDKMEEVTKKGAKENFFLSRYR